MLCFLTLNFCFIVVEIRRQGRPFAGRQLCHHKLSEPSPQMFLQSRSCSLWFGLSPASLRHIKASPHSDRICILLPIKAGLVCLHLPRRLQFPQTECDIKHQGKLRLREPSYAVRARSGTWNIHSSVNISAAVAARAPATCTLSIQKTFVSHSFKFHPKASSLFTCWRILSSLGSRYEALFGFNFFFVL